MDQLSRLLNKLNMGRSAGTLTLEDIMPLSRAELHRMAKELLSGEEVVHLHRSAQREQTENKLFAARALTRANPLLAQAIRQASSGVTAYGINDIIDPRAVQFATPGSVASMFSPAAYLTELYREARHLHPQDSAWQLDKRRPDLAKLTLNQQNMDEEISTLALANQLQMSALMTARKQTPPQLMETLATVRNSGVTPYHAPFSSVHHALTQHKVTLSDSPLGQGMTSAAQLALQANIAPELHAILTEKTDGLSETEIEEQVSKNFPGVSIERLMTLDGLAAWFALPREQIQQLLEGQQTQMAQTPDLYRNNQLLTQQIEEDGRIVTYVFNKKHDVKTNPAKYVDLLPLVGNRFLVNFSVLTTRENHPDFLIGSRGNFTGDLYRDNNFVPQAGQHYSLPVTLDAEKLTLGQSITISRYNTQEDVGYTTRFIFTRTPANPGLWLLKLNKTLRLAKASDLAPLEVAHALARLRLPDDDSEAQVIHRFYEALHYRQRYAIDLESALMLCNADISQIVYDGQLSQFDRLFNNPPLNDVRYTLGGSAIPMLPDARDPRREVLKRALRVDNIGLWQLFNLTARDDADNKDGNNIENLSDLLLVRLLADTHGLSVAELHTLLTLSPFNNINIYQITEQNRRGLIDFLWQTQQWLAAQNGSVNDVWALLTQGYGDKPTADMQPLLEALRSGAVMETELQATMAPIVATVLQLDTPTQGGALLRWLDNHRPATVPTTAEAWALIKQPTPDALAQKKIAHFCQALAQRVLVIRAMALSEVELLTLAQGAAVDTVAGVRAISDFHRVMDRCGDQAGTILEALQDKALSAKLLAQALNLAPVVLTEALTQAGWESGSDMTWQQLAALPAWLDLAQRLQITPAGVGTLLTLSQAPVATYGEWSTLAALLLAGLTPQQSLQVQQQQDQRLGEALSGDYRATMMAAPLANRDEIWRRLLVDGQVSSEVTTTRLAEAIASVQLYINRTLAGQEPGADKVLLERQFFKDWARYNKGYSTWAGVSQLAYYPENTIDPTLRIGQSGMMDEMLQQLAQSQLNSDTLEEGFRQYLTAFEQVANLKVASGYHDHPDIHQGNTWFIGYSQSEPRKYYWRSLDHSKGQDGRFAANAWSEWREIACAVTPYQGLIRPVIYRSRLYVLWVEEQQRKTADGKKDELHYALKLSHIHYDGSWASPFSFDITADLKKEKVVTAEALGLYSAANYEDDTLTVAFYQKRKSYQLVDNKLNTPHFGIRILADMTRAASTNIGGVMVAALPQLDTTEINRVNNALGGSYQSTLVQQSQQGDGLFNLALTVDEPYISQTDGHTSLVIYPMVEVMHTGKAGDSVLPSELQAICEQRLHEGADIYLPERQTFTPKNGWSVSECCLVASKRGTQNGVDERIYLSLSSQTPLKETVLNIGNWVLYGSSFNNGKTIFGGSVINIPENKTTYQINAGISTDKLLGTLDTGDLKNILADFKTQDIVLEIYNGDTRLKRVSGSDVAMTTPESNLDTMVFAFGELGVNVSDIYKDNQLNLTLKVTVKNTDGVAASTDYALAIKVPEVSKSAISLYTTDDGAQYMELDCYRTRLNTLFAQQLIARASRGVDAVLSRETQSLMEPKLGKGTYVTLTLAQYDKAIHGSDRRFSIKRSDAFRGYPGHVKVDLASGTLSLDAPTEVRLFIPKPLVQDPNPEHFYLYPEYQNGKDMPWLYFDREGDGWKLDTSKNGGTFPGLVSVGGLSQQDEPMDFSGANALYFWELFYYTPMMVASRLLQEQDFSEANRWLRYVWDPAGGTQRGGVWNTRPLDEDTTWNDDPLDSVDPDAVAQHDPMHYKMSTLMRTLDLLMARGDAAYRLLERDTLNEAKMWYVQALTLLGEKPFAATGISWAEPALGQAADDSATRRHHRRLSQMRSGEDAATPFSANSLTGVFLPQQNEKLLGYWQTLEQRLYNLRHHLAIDGQPLSLPIFATPADPAALLSAAAGRAGGGRDTATRGVPALRFPVMLDNAKAITGQLSYFGSTLLGLIERQDAEAMSELLQNQASELMVSSLRMQQQTLAELDAERAVLQHNRAGVQSRFDSYQRLYQENVSAGEQQAMNLSLLSSSITTSGKALHMAAAVADTVPNIYGLAVGGSRYGALFNATAIGIELGASATRIAADRIGQSEAWRRRRQEWEIQRNNAEAELKLLDAQLEVQAVRRQAAEMQQAYLQTQQTQSQAQLEFLQRKFSNKALYSWLRSRLTAIYFQFYDLTASRCMMAQAAWQWQTGGTETFIKPGAWQSTHAGLLCGESLQLNLAQMEAAWLKWNRRALEVTRTVSLAGVYRTDFVLTEAVNRLLSDGKGEVGSAKNGLKLTADHQLQMAFNIADLNIAGDYPAGLGKVRRIKQISVTLPALVGPYQDVRAVLSYGGTGLPDGCQAIALSHGMNDSGQFQLDFNDERWLPFEGIALEDKSSLTLSFPGAMGEQQKSLLLSLSDVIVHIHYTIR